MLAQRRTGSALTLPTVPPVAPNGTAAVEPSIHVPVQRLAPGADAGTGRRPGPNADPKFAALKADVRGKQKLLAAHPPAKSEAA
ncbi:hypothetical protein, partial [Micromonospora sonchi]|uniref:hypothetical protein n=1 Tax=Micromonospora sonchi TaxID=1763543 RepID=UPI001E4B6C1C